MEIKQSNIIRLGTRGSLLAKAQSQLIADEFQRLQPGVQVELHLIKTTGDQIADKPLHDIGGKGLFTKELEIALLTGQIDFAVHSLKDVPVTMPLVDVSGLVIAAVPPREDARDVLVGLPLDQLPNGARVGTGSLRRECQLLHHRPDLQIVPIRGNIDTRLRKQREGEVDAVILAAAGLRRAGLFNANLMHEIPIDVMVPAAGQGALALQCRAEDASTRQLLGLVNHSETERCTHIEREVIRLLNADCHSPIGVHAVMIEDQTMQVRIAIATQGSGDVIFKTVVGDVGSMPAMIRSALPG